MDRKEEELVVGGYRFGTIADAETARIEERKVASLDEHLDYHNPQNVLLVYNKALDNRAFLTPVGMVYLHKMQVQLLQCGVPREKIRPIPLYGTFSNKTEKNSSIRKSITARGQRVEFKGRFITSVCINILLAAALTAIVLLSFWSDFPTIINYRTAIVNEYSEWEQELSDRERAVREAEQALELTP